jgi:hypothetical protein
MIGLVELAQKFVALSAELEATRNAMRAALLDRSDGNPTRPVRPAGTRREWIAKRSWHNRRRRTGG